MENGIRLIFVLLFIILSLIFLLLYLFLSTFSAYFPSISLDALLFCCLYIKLELSVIFFIFFVHAILNFLSALHFSYFLTLFCLLLFICFVFLCLSTCCFSVYSFQCLSHLHSIFCSLSFVSIFCLLLCIFCQISSGLCLLFWSLPNISETFPCQQGIVH